MKKYLKFVALFAVILLGGLFLVNQRVDIKTLEEINNENYFEYKQHKEKYTVTTGIITDIVEPMGEHSIEEDPGKIRGGVLPWTCFIEFETEDGRKINDQLFLSDAKNDSIGKTVEVAYYMRTDLKNAVVATRTEYISDSIHLRRNMICIVVLITAGLAGLVFILFRMRSSSY